MAGLEQWGVTMSDGSDDDQGEVTFRATLVQFFETASLYAMRSLPDSTPRRFRNGYPILLFPTDLRIQLPCPHCEGQARTFEYEDIGEEDSRNSKSDTKEFRAQQS